MSVASLPALSCLGSHLPTFLMDHVMRMEHRLPILQMGDECHGQSHVARGWRRSHARLLSQGASCSAAAFENGGLCPSLHSSSALRRPQRARGASARCPLILGVTVLPSPGKSQVWLPLEARRLSSLLTVPWACWTGKGSAQPLGLPYSGTSVANGEETPRWHIRSDR